MSSAHDTPAPEFQEQLRTALDAIDRATQELAVSAEIPHRIAELVDTFDVLLAADRPTVGYAGIDPYLVEGLLGGALVSVKALRNEDAREGRRRLRLGLEQVRQALRDICDEYPAAEDRPAKDVVRWMLDATEVPQSEMAALLGTTPRTLQRWASDSETTAPAGDDAARVRIVARIINHLRHSFTGPGVVRWFERPHPMLSDRRPIELLDDTANFPQLMRVASRARSMVAT